MSYAVLLASSALVSVLVLAVACEARPRRALQHLLTKLLNVWRDQHAQDQPAGSSDDDGDRSVRDGLRSVTRRTIGGVGKSEP